MDLTNIPQELKSNALFCVWKLEGRGKIPFDPIHNKYAKSNDSNTFHDYNTILQHIPRYYMVNADGAVMGGLGLGIFKGFSAIDIDDCIDAHGNISEMAQDIINYIGSYTEISPSGRGIRIIFKTDTVIDKTTHYINNSNNGLEIYISDNTNKYVTLTGNIYGDIRDINKIDITYILDKYMRKKRNVTRAAATIEPSGDIVDAIGRALANNKAFKEAWERKATGSGGTENEDDLSLASYLAQIFEGDFSKINEAFLMSPYFMSKDKKHVDKWLKREDYRVNTIGMAITSYSQQAQYRTNRFALNDTGNAERFVDNYRGLVHYNVDNNRWMLWNGEYWQHDMTNHVKNLAMIVVEQLQSQLTTMDIEARKRVERNIDRVLNSAGKEAMLKEAQHLDGVPVLNVEFDQQPYLINTKSGIVDLRTSSIQPHNKELRLSKYIPHEISTKKPKLWLKFLSEIYADNKDIIPYLQRLSGYWLSGYKSEQSLYIFLGDGSNGKSLLLETLLKAMGDYGTIASSDLLIDRKYNNSSEQHLAGLIGARFVMVEETEMNDRLKEAQIKSLTSDYGEVTARFLYGNSFTYKPVFKLIMATNYSPRIYGTDHGIWRRIKVIPHNIIIEDHEQDKMLGYKLEQELPEILGWMIEGARLYFNDGLKEPAIISQRVMEYRSEQDIVEQWLVDNCERDMSYTATAKELFSDFTQYLEANGERKISNTIFGRNMGKKFERRRINNATTYIGVRLRVKSLTEMMDEVSVNEHEI